MNNFEEWLEKDIREAYEDILPESVIQSTIEYWKEKAHAIREKVIHECIEEVNRIVLVEAVQKFNSTPQIGEPFDMEKHNHANRMLNEMNSFIWKKSKQSLLNLLDKNLPTKNQT